MRTADNFWDDAAAKYSKSPIKNMPAYIQTMDRTKVHLAKGDKVLEIGCGTGSTALLLADSVAHITSTDISAKMIDIAKGKLADQQVHNVDFMQATVFDDTLKPGSYDAILAYNFLHLLDNPEDAVARVRDLLKPGGVFISKTVCLASGNPITRPVFRVLIALMQLVGKAPYVGFVKSSDPERWVTNAGFTVLEKGDYPRSPCARFVVARRS